MLVVFDEPRPLDLSAVQNDPIGAGATVQLLPEATILKLPRRGASRLSLRRVPAGWLIQSGVAGGPVKMIAPIMDGGTLRFPVQNPGRTVVVPDAQTGGNLLVGTVRTGQEMVSVGRRGSVQIIEPTSQGVVIDPLSDRLELRPTKNAFLLSGVSPGALDLANLGSGVNARIDTATPRIMSLKDRPVDVLYRQFKDAKAAAAAAPAEERFLPRIMAAEDALALGDAAEAETIAQVAMADDARDAASLRPRLILAAARLLGHRAETGDLLDDPLAAADGETGLWRAVKLAEQDPASPEAARLFAVSLPLLRSYPAALRSALLPLAEEALVRGGSDAQAAMIEHLPRGDELAFPRAILAERREQRQIALAMLDHLARDRDIVLADKAVEEAVAIREAADRSDPQKLAEVLESRLLDSRIAGRELPSRLRLAELWGKAGRWRKALDLLRQTAGLFPDQRTEVRRLVGETLKRLADAPGRPGDEGALDQAAMIEGNADMLPEGADGRLVSLFLAARLSALDLPERAAPVVQKMMRSAEPGPDKAELGLQLATLDLQKNDLSGVQGALGESDANDLSPDLVARRLLVLARALAGAGQLDEALARLGTLDTAAALDFKASLLARRGDWSGATDVLLALAQAPGSKAEGPGQDLLLRLASAASRSQDRARIKRVRDFGGGRFADPGKAALFRLLTSDPEVDDTAEAKNASEISALRHAPAIVDAISD